jgi:hypothetical protein
VQSAKSLRHFSVIIVIVDSVSVVIFFVDVVVGILKVFTAADL